MAMNATNTESAPRAPRGTKTITQAFFAAASDIPEATRPKVIKAALNTIRDQLKSGRDKARAAKVASKAKLARAPASRRPILSAATKQAVAPKLLARKTKTRPGRKPAVKTRAAPVDVGNEA